MVHAVNTESEGRELLGAKLLEGAHPFARGFQFHESNMAAGEEDQPVRHPSSPGDTNLAASPPRFFASVTSLRSIVVSLKMASCSRVLFLLPFFPYACIGVLHVPIFIFTISRYFNRPK